MTLNWQAFNPRLGFRVIISVAIGVAFANLVGLDSMIFGLGAVVISMADFRGPLRERVENLAVFTLLLSTVTAIAWIVTGEMWPVVIAITLVTLLSGFALKYKTRLAMEASILNIWLIILLPGIGSDTLQEAVVATLLSGVFVILIALVFAVVKPKKTISNNEQLHNKKTAKTSTKAKIHLSLKSPVTIFAIGKSLAAGLATLIGWLIVGAHPFWATWAPLMIIKPSLHVTVVKGVNRVIGTVLGGLAGYMLLVPTEGNATVVAALFLVSIFLQFATTGVHYALMVFFLTMELVFSGELGGGVPVTLSFDRIIATLIGVAISFGTVLILSRLLKNTEIPRFKRHKLKQLTSRE